MQIERVITEDQLKDFFEYICDNSGTVQTSFGKELEFFERNGFHSSICNRLYSSFPDFVRMYRQSTNLNFLNDVKTRGNAELKLALQLRCWLRASFNINPLTNEDVKDFFFDKSILPNLGKLSPFVNEEKTYVTNQYEQQLAADYAVHKYPEAVQYIKALLSIAPSQGYEVGSVGGDGLPLSYAADSLAATIQDVEQYTRITGAYDVIDLLRK